MVNYFKCLVMTMGENDPEIASTYHYIGSVYYFQGDYNEALENYFKCL